MTKKELIIKTLRYVNMKLMGFTQDDINIPSPGQSDFYTFTLAQTPDQKDLTLTYKGRDEDYHTGAIGNETSGIIELNGQILTEILNFLGPYTQSIIEDKIFNDLTKEYLKCADLDELKVYMRLN